MSTRPQRAAKSRAIQNVLAPSDVEMGFEESSDAMSDGEHEASDSDSGGSTYGVKSSRRKRKGKKAGSDETRKRSRVSLIDELRGDGVLNSGINQKKPNRLLRLVTGPKSRAAQAKEKKRSSGSKRCFGKLKGLLDAPLDILCDILSHLEPLDLLNLARSSWALHETIISRQMRVVWQARLKAHNVPSLPKEVQINEVQLACMLFDNHCQACGALALNRGFHDQLLVRLCRGCLKYNTSSGLRIANMYCKGLAKNTSIFSLLPSKRNKYLNPDFQDVIEKYVATPSNSVERQRFLKEKKEVTVAVNKYARQLSSWRHDKHREEDIENYNAMTDRQDSICKKVYDLGYTEEEFEFCLGIGHRGSRTMESIMFQPRRLTDKIWNSISKELLEYMERSSRLLRLQKKREELRTFWEPICDAYSEAHDGVGPKFNFADLLKLPSVEVFVDDNNLDKLPDTLFSDLEQRLPPILEERPANVEAECLEIIRKGRKDAGLPAFESLQSMPEADEGLSSLRDVPTTDYPLHAVSTAFAVGDYLGCLQLVSYREFMDKCFIPACPTTVLFGLKPSAWTAPEFQKSFAKDAEDILKDLGLPLNVSLSYMDKMAKSLRCSVCTHYWPFPPGTWIRWVQHYGEHVSKSVDAAIYFDDKLVEV